MISADVYKRQGEHSGKLLIGNAGEKHRRMEHRKKFFHKKTSFVEKDVYKRQVL